VRRILVFSMTRMGDIIQSIPFVRRLRKQNPDAQIDLLVEKCFADVASFLPGIDRIIEIRLEDLLLCFDKKRGEDLPRGISYYNDLVNTLRGHGYDEVWNLTHTKPFTVLSSLVAGAEARGVTIDDHGLQRVNDPWLRYFYATNLSRPWCQYNLVDIYANCINDIPRSYGRSVQIDPLLFRDHMPEKYPPKKHKKRVAIHPGASQAQKQWPVESFAHVAKELIANSIEIVLIGGKSDRKLKDALGCSEATFDLIGKTTVKELAAVLDDCDLLISNDSGPMHVAAAVGTTVIAVTIGSALGSETAPYGAGHWVIEPAAECFPCSSSNASCRDLRCATEIAPHHVFDLAMTTLAGAEPSNAISSDTSFRLYRTEFDADDEQLNLVRVGNHPADSRDRLNAMLRNLWPVWLENTPVSLVKNEEPDARISLALRTAYLLACQAEASCLEIANIKTESAAGIAAVKSESVRLAEIDAKIARSLLSNDALKSILAYLIIEKGSVAGSSLSEQARHTAAVYSGLARMLRTAVPDHLQNMKKSNITFEAYHENLT